jgi:hypothetical protein
MRLEVLTEAKEEQVAEIKVERKERSVWPWIIGALVLLALIWFFFIRPETDGAEFRAGDAEVEVGLVVAPVPAEIV